ncbi:MAG: large conductance mechanosensitive channel protein MscL [Acidimicrobiia bacterium]
MAEGKNGILTEFKEFALEGNVLELAIAFILGLYFKQIVDALVHGVILAAVGAIFGEANFNDLTFNIGDGVIRYGTFITAIVTFLIVAAALFAVVKFVDTAKELQKRGKPGMPPEKRDCPLCFTEVSAKASRCPACTGEIQPLVA